MKLDSKKKTIRWTTNDPGDIHMHNNEIVKKITVHINRIKVNNLSILYQL